MSIKFDTLNFSRKLDPTATVTGLKQKRDHPFLLKMRKVKAEFLIYVG